MDHQESNQAGCVLLGVKIVTAAVAAPFGYWLMRPEWMGDVVFGDITGLLAILAGMLMPRLLLAGENRNLPPEVKAKTISFWKLALLIPAVVVPIWVLVWWCKGLGWPAAEGFGTVLAGWAGWMAARPKVRRD